MKWDERIKMINWVDKILNKLDKYELLYPHFDPDVFFNQTKTEHVQGVKLRQDKVRDTLCREMGIDFSIF